MAVEAADLLFPVGPLEAAVLWPGISPTTVKGYLDAFIADGVARVATWDAADRDAGTRAWAKYRTYDAVFNRLVALPGTVAFQDEGSGGYFVTQMQYMQEQRDAALAEFTALEVGTGVVDQASYGVITSLR